MTEHRVRMRYPMPKPGGGHLVRPVCDCGERGPLTPLQQTADNWADEHMREVRA